MLKILVPIAKVDLFNHYHEPEHSKLVLHRSKHQRRRKRR